MSRKRIKTTMDFGKMKNKIPKLTNEDLIALDKELFEIVESSSGIGFWNRDMGHPAYVMGAEHGPEEKIIDPTWGDGPDANSLYKLLRDLHMEMRARGLTICRVINNWQDFCQWAVQVYKRKRN